MPDPVLALQRSLIALALDPDAAAFEADPGAFAAVRGLAAGDQAAFRRFRDRLLYYRDAVRDDLWEPIDQDFPLTRALLEGAGRWEAFLDSLGEAVAGFIPLRPRRPSSWGA